MLLKTAGPYSVELVWFSYGNFYGLMLGRGSRLKLFIALFMLSYSSSPILLPASLLQLYFSYASIAQLALLALLALIS